ncbi:hypothetical protein AB0L65_32780 [Nonomuraea sp. NPDC052116]|uniref:hypothetical protein n=1 Tax=Nonomuraea sp. NPDC052116 TaxID=3155665 RepID=UPI0034354290
MTHVDDLYEPGDGREPGEPDVSDEQPVNLDEVEQRLERLKFLAPPFGMVATRAELNGTEDLHDLAALIGQEVHGLIAEVRESRQRIAEWEALPTREEWTVTSGQSRPPRSGDLRFTADAAMNFAARDGKQAWRQVVLDRAVVRPWEPIDEKAPF